MKTLTVRGMPSELHAALKQRAQENRRSLNQEILAELMEFPAKTRGLDRVDRLVALSNRLAENGKPPLTTEEISVGIREGRL